MVKVKLSYPSWWDQDWGGGIFLWETPNRSGQFSEITYYINKPIEKCDYWFVFDDIDQYLFEKTICPRKNVFFITGEVNQRWNYDERFLNQFSGVLTARADLSHPCLFREQHICAWHIKKDMNFLESYKPTNKAKELSAIISSANKAPGHQERFQFITKLKHDLGHDLDWYGKGVNPIDDKWLGLEQYKYSVAIENSCYHNYFTEKILDCYLSYTMPIYFGCPNILDFFPEESMLLIDINNYEKSLEKIKKAIADNLYDKSFDAILDARKKVLSQLSFFSYLNNWILELEKPLGNKEKVYVQQQKAYTRKYTVKQSLYKIFAESKLGISGYDKPLRFNNQI
mgnify:CR=1 FL=1